MENQISPLQVFILFDNDDQDVFERIHQHCAPLERQGKIRIWHHQRIRPGQLVEQETLRYLEKSDVVLLMISSSLLNSERFYEVEKISLERAWSKKSIVIPVYLKYCLFTGYEFTQLQMVPHDGQPVVIPDSDLDERCREVAVEIHNLVDNLKEIGYADAEDKTTVGIPYRDNDEITNILYVINNPGNKNPDSINEEINCIKQRLVLGKCSCQYELIPKSVNTIEELQRALLETRPHIVHFSEYATHEDRLTFISAEGEKIYIDPAALCTLFAQFNDRLELVFLNACYSAPQAESIADAVEYVIGISGDMKSSISLDFVRGFYQAISYGTSVEKGYRLGKNLLQLKSISDFESIILLHRENQQRQSSGSDLSA